MVNGHARIRYPKPLGAAVESPGGNYYNNPLRPDGSDFPCKGLHKKAGVDKTPTETWQPGQEAYFEILGHGATGGEGNLAAHSGGSCQASISFDNGETWKVLHSYIGGCPRGAQLGSNMASKDQKFTFMVPVNTKAGDALFSWSWIAVTGNRNEFYQNCASVKIAGSGNSTLNDLPDMFLGDMTIAGHIGAGECRSFSGHALEYPNPGEARTISQVQRIAFKRPTNGKCFTKASNSNSTTLAPYITTGLTTPSSATTSTKSSTTTKPTTPVPTRPTTTTRPTTPVPTRPTTTTKPTTPVPTRPTTTAKTSVTSKSSTTTVERITSTISLLPGQLPPQCSTYMTITDKSRQASQPSHIGCDNAIFKSKTVPTWVRFSGGAGTRLVTGPTEPFRCGTQGAGWYSGTYTSSPGTTVSGKVCYSWPNSQCQWNNTISITNCKDYYVFALTAPPACYLRYCTV